MGAKLNRNRKTKKSRGDILFAILRKIGESGIRVAEFMMDPTSWDPTLVPRTTYYIPGYYNRAVKRWLARMQRFDLVAYKKQGKHSLISLTPRGKKKLLELEVKKLRIPHMDLWDGIWRIVVFDIPEEMRGVRTALRRRMRELGFEQLQKSVFVIPYPCANEIHKLADFYGLSWEHIRIIEAKYFDGDDEYRGKFEL